jgi:hypothetical protein
MSPSFERIPRRTVLKALGAGIAFLVLGKWGLSVPDYQEEEAVSKFTPGWLEKRQPERPAFISSESGGHAEYLHFMAVNDGIINKILRQAFADLSQITEGPRPSLATVFRTHLKYAKEALGKDVPISEAMHVAFFTFAAVHSTFFSHKEMRDNFGLSIDYPPGKKDDPFYMGAFENGIPVVFADDNGEEKGIDKSFHFGNFAFIAHEYWYAKRWGLQEANRIPNAARILADTAGSPEKNAERLVAIGQYVWETDETLSWIDDMFKKRAIIWPPHTGLFEPDVVNDYRANKLGVIFALSVVGDSLTEDQVLYAIDNLDYPNDVLAKVQ